MGRREGAQLPRVFYVNWFRKDASGKFLFADVMHRAGDAEQLDSPGEALVEERLRRDDARTTVSRVPEMISFTAISAPTLHVATPIGLLPTESAINTEGLDIFQDSGRPQFPQINKYLAKFGDKLPAEVGTQLEALEQRLG